MQPLPTEPGRYLDPQGQPWYRHLTGVWEDPTGRIKPITHNQALVIFGPFTGPEEISQNITQK